MATLVVFLSTLLLSFAVTLAAAGLLGAYYGKGRSRSLGWILVIVAVLLAAVFCALAWPLVPGIEPRFDPRAVAQSMVAVIAALVGAVAAAGLFVSLVTRE